MSDELTYRVYLVEGRRSEDAEWRLYEIFIWRNEAKAWMQSQDQRDGIQYRIM